MIKLITFSTIWLFFTSNFDTDLKSTLEGNADYPSFKSIYWVDSVELKSYRELSEEVFKKYFTSEYGQIYTWHPDSEVKFYLLGHLKFEEDYTALIVCMKQDLLNDKGVQTHNYSVDICFFDKKGNLQTNHEFASAFYHSDTLLWGGFSKINKYRDHMIYHSSLSKENPYNNEVKLTSDKFDFVAFDENGKAVNLIFKD